MGGGGGGGGGTFAHVGGSKCEMKTKRLAVCCNISVFTGYATDTTASQD